MTLLFSLVFLVLSLSVMGGGLEQGIDLAPLQSDFQLMLQKDGCSFHKTNPTNTHLDIDLTLLNPGFLASIEGREALQEKTLCTITQLDRCSKDGQKKST